MLNNLDQLKTLILIKGEEKELEDSFPLSSLSHLHFQSTSLLSILSCRLIYQQLGDLQVRQNHHTSADGRVTELVASVGYDGG